MMMMMMMMMMARRQHSEGRVAHKRVAHKVRCRQLAALGTPAHAPPPHHTHTHLC
jgi:hypothetical protein